MLLFFGLQGRCWNLRPLRGRGIDASHWPQMDFSIHLPHLDKKKNTPTHHPLLSRHHINNENSVLYLLWSKIKVTWLSEGIKTITSALYRKDSTAFFVSKGYGEITFDSLFSSSPKKDFISSRISISSGETYQQIKNQNG